MVATLVELLKQLQGSSVVVKLSVAEDDGGDAPGSVLNVMGELRPAPRVHPSVHAFWIGDASCPAGATLQLSESAFRRATLTTFDGNDFFIVRIQLGRLEILVQDQASGTP